MKKVYFLLMTLSVLFFFTGCLSDGSDISGTESYRQTGIDTSIERSTEMNLSEDGSFSIERVARDEVVSMGDPGTWTIFVYMCGTDLESESGLATNDLQEMIDGTANNKIRYIVQTGGTYLWDNDLVDDALNQRFLIQNQDIELIEESDLTNMGSAETLSDFLNWGVASYPAENMGLIFWNHGGGSIAGVCFDEMSDYDSLTLLEIENSLASVYPQMTDSFEFIGFDACLMGTVETANVLAPHARYLYGSEETEPGEGWDYVAIGNALSADNTQTGAQLGKTVVDSFYDSCAQSESESEATLSCIDLSKIDELVYAFNTVAENVYSSSDDSNTLSNIVRGFTSAENYGGNNKSEGYTNMVDLGSILENLSNSVSGCEQALTALDDCVLYMRNGENKPNAHGLAIYYPLAIQGTMELGIFKDICISPYYMTFVDKMAYANDSNGILTTYSDSDWLSSDSPYWGLDYSETIDDSYWLGYSYDDEESYNFDEESSSVTYASEPALDADGMFGFTITPDTLDYVDAVYCDVFMDIPEDETLVELGLDDNVTANWDTGEFEDNFSGYWFALPDGQPLATYIVEQGDSYNIYTSPVMVNDAETNLRIRLDFLEDDDYVIQIIGTWDGIDPETGQSAREIEKLKTGDVIVPMYDSYTYDGDYADLYVGEEYVFDNDPIIYEEMLPVGDYYYSFQIDDIFGGSLYTDFEVFNVDVDGEIYFYE
ncbi:clostripain-related cysteine peptidase [Eubacteriaceae bacterium ES2]|nr:clostripain-related cysteine peptidase [Eubacteriaceae bacterium ES2]